MEGGREEEEEEGMNGNGFVCKHEKKIICIFLYYVYMNSIDSRNSATINAYLIVN